MVRPCRVQATISGQMQKTDAHPPLDWKLRSSLYKGTMLKKLVSGFVPVPLFRFVFRPKFVRMKMNENSTLTPTAEQLEKLAEWLRRSGRPQSADTLLRRYIEILKETNNAK